MNHQSLSDDMLSQLLRADDDKAFEEIYKRYWKKTFTSTYQKINNIEVAKELVQSLFLRIWERRATNNINNLQGYIQTAIKNSIINYLASQLVKEKYEKYLTLIQATTSTVESDVSYKELKYAIEHALQHLPTKTAAIFRMSRFENLSIK